MRSNLKRLVMMLGLVVMTSIVCMAQSSQIVIQSNFNGTNIGPGRWVYFNSVFNPSGLSNSGPTTVTLSNASLDIEGMVYQLPGAVVTFDPNATTPSTQFVGGQWHTTVPTNLGGNKVLTVFPIFFPNGLPGGANPVTFRGTITSSIPGVCGPVQWAAAVYTQMPSDLNQLGVKVADHFGGAHHAGTPENYTQFVIGGARGGGGSNFTGSYSATGHFCSEVMTPTPTPTPSQTPTPGITQTPTSTPTETPTPPTSTPTETPTPGMTPTPTPPEVPEPGTVLLLGTGLMLGLGVFAFRKLRD